MVNATVRAFDDTPMVLMGMNISTTAGSPQYWKAMQIFHDALPSLNDAGGAGYYYMTPNLPLSKTTATSSFTIALIFPNTTDTASIDKLHAPMMKSLNATAGVTTQYTTQSVPSIGSFIPAVLISGDADDTGSLNIISSRLYSRDLLMSDDGPEQLVSAFRQLDYHPGSSLVGHVVAGGKVADNARTVDSALNPAWRKTLVHVVISIGWSSNATVQERQDARQKLTTEGSILRTVQDPSVRAAYLNEADAEEPCFQTSFWGENYPRLYEIKQKWDPSGLFMARKTVGSEDWDDEGLCRV